jgi:hypothetical protein
MSSMAPPTSVPITMSVQDSPPAGVTVLSFQIQITSASLQPSIMTSPVVPLLAKPTDVELEHLQSEPALLRSLNVPAGTYNSVTVAFTNSRMTIFNSTTAPIAVGSTTCAANSPCNLTPVLASATITVNTPPVPKRQRSFGTFQRGCRFRWRIAVQHRGDAHACSREGVEARPVFGRGHGTNHHIFVRNAAIEG